MLSEEQPTASFKMYRKSSWVRANKSGVFTEKVAFGAQVEKKKVLGQINDPFGGKSTKLVSLHSGTVIGLNNNPIVHKGDAVEHVAYNP